MTHNFKQLKDNMVLRESGHQEKVMEQIRNCNSMEEKAILIRAFAKPQGKIPELIIKEDLLIDKPVDELSGDGCKNGINYEIKYSGHAERSKFNWVQIRPDHNVDYYILCGYNMYYDDLLGKVFTFKIPAQDLYDLIVDYGGYAHGTIHENGKITKENLKGRGLLYALRVQPNAERETKCGRLWSRLLEYEVDYNADNF
jgi:hypothetical protein